MQTQQVGGNANHTTPAGQSQTPAGDMPQLAAALDALERRAGIPFETLIKLPAQERCDHRGRRLVPVIAGCQASARH